MASQHDTDQGSEPFTTANLADLYTELTAADGVSVAALSALVAAFRDRPLSDADLQSYREGGKPWKKLRDEVVPVERFLSERYPASSRVRFPLDDKAPDAWLLADAAAGAPRGIEVTGALARAGVEVAKSLAGGGIVPGFIALQDDVSGNTFAEVRKRGRILHSRREIDRATDEAIAKRMDAKDNPKFEDFILLVTAPLGSSPSRSATSLREVHGAKAEALPFAEVHVLDDSGRSPTVRLK